MPFVDESSSRRGGQVIFQEQHAEGLRLGLEFDFVGDGRMLPFAADDADLAALQLQFGKFLDQTDRLAVGELTHDNSSQAFPIRPILAAIAADAPLPSADNRSHFRSALAKNVIHMENFSRFAGSKNMLKTKTIDPRMDTNGHE
jgi:hypothetical protein